MYYYWGGWWWLLWVIPFLFLFWGLTARSDRRYWARDRYRSRDAYDEWGAGYRNFGGKYRNRGPLNYRRPDDRVREDICDRLMLNDDIDPYAVEVLVENGRVTLKGVVESRFEKRLSEHIADSVAGVVDVDNQLRIGKVDHTTTPPKVGPSAISEQHA